MGMFVCEICGTKFRDDSRKYRRFCSKKCSNTWHMRTYRDVIKAAQPKEVQCNHNSTVFCKEPKRCASCGWNPEVAAVRRDEILKRLGVVMP